MSNKYNEIEYTVTNGQLLRVNKMLTIDLKKLIVLFLNIWYNISDIYVINSHR